MSARSKYSRILKQEVNKLIHSEQFEISTLQVLHSRLNAIKAELAALNSEMKTFMTHEQVEDGYDFVIESEDAAISASALLQHHMDELKVFSPTSTMHPPATAYGDPPVTSERGATRPHREFGTRLPKLELLRLTVAFGSCSGTPYAITRACPTRIVFAISFHYLTEPPLKQSLEIKPWIHHTATHFRL
ncbi:hypothetical protein HPB52_016739 [Rhipicephalus sanguineus]|uniref:Uncharacterized protein n=1 Tax=Rhipicephalus sanguineus TaxID=34632 RepID=A0A9D4PK20_RHISA|nr:hypothetical protein HPB52_016739 [Rhipicephalus sanguineus]